MANSMVPSALMGLGLAPDLANQVGNYIASVTATGTDIAHAAAVPPNTGTVLITGASSQTGVVLDANTTVGSFIFVKGVGAVAPVVYVPSGHAINAAAASITFGAATAAGIIFRTSTTQWYSYPLVI